MNKEEKKKEILHLVEEYANEFLIHNDDFKIGDRINYGGRYFNSSEVCSLVDSALDFWLTEGKYCNEFEKKLSEYLDVQHTLLVNSGSSANELAFYTLTANELGERRIKRGDEIITLACTFPTTIAPIIHYGAVPVFIDVCLPTYNINIDNMKKALSKKTKAVMMAHTLGNPFNIAEVKKFCNENNLWLIEDNCDALGAEAFVDNKWKKTGSIGDIGTSSFYPPHHITTGEGGAVYTNDNLLYKIARSFRDWGRDCFCKSGVDNTCKKRFTGVYGELPKGYDHKYVYSHFGFNLKATEMQAAIGVEQLKKLSRFVEIRNKNFNTLYTLLKNAGMDKYFILPEKTANTKASWFGFLLTCNSGDASNSNCTKIDRNYIINYLEAANIQTRMLFSGNIIKHPCFDEFRNDNTTYKVVGGLDITDYIMNNTFWVGLYPGMNDKKIHYVSEKIIEAVKTNSEIK